MIRFLAKTDLRWPSNVVIERILMAQRQGCTVPECERGVYQTVRAGEFLPITFPEISIPPLVKSGKVEVVFSVKESDNGKARIRSSRVSAH